jgi:hypothetical protein
VGAAIAATLPAREGQRSRKVFDLIRRLKAIPGLRDADPAAFRPVVQQWHKLALPVIGTKPFSATWAAFVASWPKVRHAAGEGPVDAAFARAMERKPPKLAAKLYGEDDPIVKLAALCRELQRGVSDGEFFRLDCRTAGRLLDVSHKTAWAWLNALAGDGILAIGERGSKATHKANEYTYVGGKGQSSGKAENARHKRT